MADVTVSTFANDGCHFSKLFDNNLSTYWESRYSPDRSGEWGYYWDRNPTISVKFYSMKQVNRVKLVRILESRYHHRYSNACVILLDDTNNKLDEKCTGPAGIYGEPYLVKETNSIVMSFNSVQNVKTVKLNFKGKEFAHIAELFIDGLH